jgi:TatD DNase family protein
MNDLTDTHCHIQSIGLKEGERTTRELWAKDPALSGDSVVQSARQAGVTRMICVGCDLADSRLAAEFAVGHDGCWASIGIHPHEAKDNLTGEILSEFAALTHHDKVVAIGECGLDYFYEHSPRAEQLKALKFQLELAAEAGLPVIFHVREAFDDFWPVFDEYKGLKGVLHSYTDTAANLDKAIERGLYIGVNGIATFAKDPTQLEVYKQVPLGKLLLETDAPFLTPNPFRGSINTPERIGVIADFMAKLRDESREELAEKTTSNARELFGV